MNTDPQINPWILALLGAAGVLLWLVSRRHWSSRLIEHWARRSGFRLISCTFHPMGRGPFPPSFSQAKALWRITVETPDGTRRSGWLRSGSWLRGHSIDTLEVAWDGPKPQPPPARNDKRRGFPVIMPHESDRKDPPP